VKQPQSGRRRPVSDTVHDGTPQVTASADAKAQDNRGIHHRIVTSLGGRPEHGKAPCFYTSDLIPQVEAALAAEADERNRNVILATPGPAARG
jgi:hypothetical protein